MSVEDQHHHTDDGSRDVIAYEAVPSAPGSFQPRPKFQHRYTRHVILFILTLASTTLAGGFWFSIPLMLIISAHEFGHYWYCRRYDIDATLPFFIPFPFSFAGTFGAVIRIREPFPSKKALFDVAVAGPIAGFVMLLPFLAWGITQSTAMRIPSSEIYFGEPLLFKLVSWWWFGPLPAGFDEALHPTAFAAWFGMLVTALNLLPFGQLDGGHISYAAFGRAARLVSGLTLTATLLLAVQSASLIGTALIMLAMAYFLGLRHPQIPDEDAPLDNRRKTVAILALVMFVLCFTPVPIQLPFGK